jgi:hypothetical protein
LLKPSICCLVEVTAKGQALQATGESHIQVRRLLRGSGNALKRL